VFFLGVLSSLFGTSAFHHVSFNPSLAFRSVPLNTLSIRVFAGA
jgi:hypothetical protein